MHQPLRSRSAYCCFRLWFSSRTTSPHSAARIFSRLASASSRVSRSTSARHCSTVSPHPAPPAAIAPLSLPLPSPPPPPPPPPRRMSREPRRRRENVAPPPPPLGGVPRRLQIVWKQINKNINIWMSIRKYPKRVVIILILIIITRDTRLVPRDALSDATLSSLCSCLSVCCSAYSPASGRPPCPQP
ncbi:hypothetical protein EYF80_044466 [Liparis tanakae]|uniref:Uncharacterized protein n=1 Tax=Liparis tanakae TaxID=230148 RepID=A0A4Z2FWR0_9TELE|nr:hypothetical protein EYF80_044466 [Liparis tanakae]